MLTRILEWSLGHRGLVLVAWGLVAGLGVWSLSELPLDAFPDTTPVQVHIHASAPALGPLEIERQLTTPLEGAIGGIPSLEEVRSVSKFGFCQLTVTFADGTDTYWARQVIAERLAEVALPPGVERPRLGPVSTGLGEIFHYLVRGEGLSLAELREVQDWIVKPQLRTVSGVAEVNSWGGDERRIDVVVDPQRLQRYDLSLSELAAALEANNANAGGGTLDRGGESRLVQGVGLVTRPEDVGEIVVAARSGVPVRVRDVARVEAGRELRRGAVTADGDGEVVLGLALMLSGENSRAVSTRLSARLTEIEKTLPAGARLETVYDRTHLVDRVLASVRDNLVEAAILVVAVLFAFLGSLRAGLLVAAAIPLSMLFASSLMLEAGIAGSLMSLGALDFGLLVDSSVIQVENVARRAELERGGRPWAEIVRDAVLEVRGPTLFGELIIAIVYLPVLTLEGVEGRLFRPMALTVLFALLGSMLLSLTLMPVLASLGLRRARHRWLGGGWLVRRYRAALEAALARPGLVLGLTGLVFVNGALLATRLGAEFVPRLLEGAIVINKVQLAGVSVEESVRVSSRIERALAERFPDEVERVWTRTGAAEVATDPMGLELADVFVTLRPSAGWTRARTQPELTQAIADTLAALPGMRLIYSQPIEMRLNEMIAGIRSDLGVRLFGDDLEVLRSKAKEIEAALARVPGAVDVVTEQLTGQPVVTVDVVRSAVARHGIPVREVLASVEALGGLPVGQLYDGERRFPIVVKMDERYSEGEAALGAMLVAAASGDRVPLGRLAEIRSGEGPASINRE